MGIAGLCHQVETVLRTCWCETEALWSFLPLHVEQLVLATACGRSLDWMVWFEMANPCFPPSPWLSLYIETTHIQSHGLGFFQTFSSVTEFVHQSHLIILDVRFLHPMQLSTLPYSLALGLFLTSHKTHSFFILSRENATDFMYLRQPLGTEWEEKGWQQNKAKPNLQQESGNCIHLWECGEETSLWNRSLLWQQVPQLRFREVWMTQWVRSSSCFRYLNFLNSKTQGIQN